MNRRRLLAPVIALICAVLVGCGSSKLSADPTTPVTASRPKTLRTVMAGRGFRTDVPTGWVVRHQASGGIDTYTAHPPKSSSVAEGSFSVTRLPFTAVPASALPGVDIANAPLVDLLPRMVGRTSNDTDVTVTVPPHDLTLADESAASVTTTFVESGVAMSSQTTLIRRDHVFYLLDATASTENFLAVLALLEQSEDRIIWL